MRFGKPIAIASLVGASFTAGCSSPEQLSEPQPTQANTIPTTQTLPTTTEAPGNGLDLEYTDDPHEPRPVEGKFKATLYAYCEDNPRTWAVLIDNDTADIESKPSIIGAVRDVKPDGSPLLQLGAVVLGIGDQEYRVVTSDSPEDTFSIDLGEQPFSTVLKGNDDYDAVFSAHIGADNLAYFTINCLPNFGFNGNQVPVPLDEIPTIPPSTVIPEAPHPGDGTYV